MTEVDEKLGILIEGGGRMFAESLKGIQWAKPYTVRSAVDLVDIIASLSGESQGWTNRAKGFMIDELRDKVCFKILSCYGVLLILICSRIPPHGLSSCSNSSCHQLRPPAIRGSR